MKELTYRKYIEFIQRSLTQTARAVARDLDIDAQKATVFASRIGVQPYRRGGPLGQRFVTDTEWEKGQLYEAYSRAIDRDKLVGWTREGTAFIQIEGKDGELYTAGLIPKTTVTLAMDKDTEQQTMDVLHKYAQRFIARAIREVEEYED